MRKSPTPRRKGILAGGNWITDRVKLIDVYPQPEQLANIAQHSEGTGGAAYNVLVDLARLGAPFPLLAAGLVGKDELGDRILSVCQQNRIDIKHLKQTAKAPTSYTDVMTETKGGRRTFFHLRGANALWTGADLDFAKIKARIFHLGYLLLLDELDQPDRLHGTKAAALLARAQAAGLKTSVDVVSEDGDRYVKIVTPALKYADYAIVNELEAGRTTGFKIRQPDGTLDPVALRHAAGSMLQMGVKEAVVIHFPEGGFARTRKGDDFWQSAVKLPIKAVTGTAGAGDAFCAGVLLGLHEGWELAQCLELAVCAAAACLAEATCTDGMRPMAATLQLGKRYRYRPSIEPAD